MSPTLLKADREAGAAPGAWPSLRAASRRWLWITLAVALIAHLPALPFDGLFLARLFFHTPAAEPPPEEHELLIPVDLDLLAGEPRSEDAPAPQGSAEPAAPAPASEPAADPAKQAAKLPEPAAKDSKAEDIYDDLDKPRHGAQTVKDPLAVAGGPGKFGPKAAHVQVLFNGNRLRGNNAGGALGGVLTALPEWKSFFAGTGIDPIADAEHLLIAGPQFRRSKDVVVWMQYRVPESEMRAAIDTLVKRTKRGKWIEDAPVPAAIARAHRHTRIFALIPGKKLLAVLPYSMRGDLEKLKSVRAFNQTSKAGIVIALSPPRNAFAGYEDVVDVPKTLKWMRMVVTPRGDGGADVTLEMGDADAAAAAKDAPIIEKQLSQVRTLAKLATIIGAEVLPPMTVEVDHDVLRVNATVSQKGLSHILNLAQAHFQKKVEDKKDDDSDVYDDEEKGAEPAAAPKGSTVPAGPAPSGSAAAASPSSSAGAEGSAAPSSSAAPRRPKHLQLPFMKKQRGSED